MASAARQINYADSNDVPALVVITKDTAGVARGSWFASCDAKVARASAKANGLIAVPVKGAELMALANRVPKGRIFDSGKLFMPRIQGEVFVKLEGHAPAQSKAPKLTLVSSAEGKDAGSDDKPAASSSTGDMQGTLPSDWSKIGVGSLVLARDVEEESDAYYAAIVQGKPSPTKLTLKWQNYPDLALITRDTRHIAMLHPKIDQEELEWEQ